MEKQEFASRKFCARSLKEDTFQPPGAMIQAGSRVRFSRMPKWVESLPEKTRRVFEFCLGRIYTVEEIDGQGLYVLDVSSDIDHRFGGYRNDIRVEAEFLDEIN